MLFYLLYDADAFVNPYGILTSEGRFTGWKSLEALLSLHISDYNCAVYSPEVIAQYVLNPVYPIIATFDHLPTAESNPELFI